MYDVMELVVEVEFGSKVVDGLELLVSSALLELPVVVAADITAPWPIPTLPQPIDE